MVKILISDVQSYLDNMRGEYNILKDKNEFYIETLKLMMKKLDIAVEKVEFIVGSDYQFK